ncbi:hypothetical protein [Roseicella aquatilis]|uniref:Uncharacterized protein n=1 Tax=Roseicella aquatilis TaxID=2527868 RepID=A0A4V2WJJ1_9PROT|nr:hypothetical protein [Roseicella aquatilis]TCZ54227.1 hypothetical protein EXY23_23625 [Roseicella aquatilis]
MPASLTTRPASESATKSAPAQLPLGLAGGVRVILEGSDLAAVEAAAAEMKVRFGARFAVTGRRMGPDRRALRISAGLVADAGTAMDAEGIRQWALPGRTAMAAGPRDDQDGAG